MMESPKVCFTICVTVMGMPQTAGSKRAFPFKRFDGSLGVRVTDDNPKGRGWKDQIIYAVRDVYRGPMLDGPLEVAMRFYRPRPKGHFSKHGLNKVGLASPFPATRPDVLKYARCAEDALNGILYRDDAQIVRESLAKEWGEPARMEIEITCLEPEAPSLLATIPRETLQVRNPF